MNEIEIKIISHQVEFLRIIFRTNGGFKIGLGHYKRCLNLAYAIKTIDSSIDIIFIQNEDLNQFKSEYEIHNSENFDLSDVELINKLQADAVVIDSYFAKMEYLLLLRKNNFLILFDDNNDIHDKIPSNVLINGNFHSNKLKYLSCFGDTHFLLGPKYLVMNQEYWNFLRDNDDSLEVKSILITTGGADFNNVMPKFIKSLKNQKYEKKILIGPYFSKNQIEIINQESDSNFTLIFNKKNIFEMIISSDIIITASGSTVYEVLTLQKLPIIYSLADNQLELAKELELKGIPNLGWYQGINWTLISNKIDKIIAEKRKIENKIKSIFSSFDGQGALRTADFIYKLLKK